MRIKFLVVGLALPLAACVTTSPTVVQKTPASIAYECMGAMGCTVSLQQVADEAQTHCRAHGKNAQVVTQAIAPSGNLRAQYNCV